MHLFQHKTLGLVTPITLAMQSNCLTKEKPQIVSNLFVDQRKKKTKRVCSLRVYQLRTGAVKPRLLVRPVTQIPERSLVHQEGLPKLPVPPLKQTCEGYLAALEPIVSAEELDHTRQLVGEFLHGGVGERLQKGLERRARKTENWVDIWAYLADDFTLSK